MTGKADATETETSTETETDQTTEKSEVDWKSRAREWEKRAKANADAATKFAEFEESQKSDVQKLSDAKTAAENDATAARAEALRWRVAAKHGLTDEDAELFLTGTDEATLTKQAERLTERVADKKKNGNVVPTEGRTPSSPGADPIREFARELFGTTDS